MGHHDILPTPSQAMEWLKNNGWQCVRDYDFSADFAKAEEIVNLPLWTAATSHAQRMEDAVSIIATCEGKTFAKLLEEML